MTDNTEKLLTLLSEVFAVDADAINNETSPDNLKTWDSFNTLKMIMKREETL